MGFQKTIGAILAALEETAPKPASAQMPPLAPIVGFHTAEAVAEALLAETAPAPLAVDVYGRLRVCQRVLCSHRLVISMGRQYFLVASGDWVPHLLSLQIVAREKVPPGCGHRVSACCRHVAQGNPGGGRAVGARPRRLRNTQKMDSQLSNCFCFWRKWYFIPKRYLAS